MSKLEIDRGTQVARADRVLESVRAIVNALLHPGPPPPPWPRVALIVLTATLLLIAVLLFLGATLYDNPGHLFRERKAGTYGSFFLLLGSAFVAARTASRLRGERFGRFWWTTAVLFAYLGCDDLFVIHEHFDRLVHHVLGLDPDNATTDHFDDAIVGAYGLVALRLAWWFRADLLRLPHMVLSMIPAFGAFALMVFFDWRGGHKAIEDSFKVLAAALILIGFLAAWFELRERSLRTASLFSVDGRSGEI